jgi:hypothetical protein
MPYWTRSLAATTEEVCVGTRFLVEFVGHSSNDLDTSRAIFGADEILARDTVGSRRAMRVFGGFLKPWF